jgi:hypothetical protein
VDRHWPFLYFLKHSLSSQVKEWLLKKGKRLDSLCLTPTGKRRAMKEIEIDADLMDALERACAKTGLGPEELLNRCLEMGMEDAEIVRALP